VTREVLGSSEAIVAVVRLDDSVGIAQPSTRDVPKADIPEMGHYLKVVVTLSHIFV